MDMTLTPLRKAKGVVLVLTALSLLVILGMAGLAIDLGHSYSNKTRLQNSVDAAALAAAMKLLLDLQNNIGNPTPVTTDAANAAGEAAHQANLTGFGSNWLPNEYTTPTIQFCWTRNLQNFNGCKLIESFSPQDPTNPLNTKFFVRASVASTALTNFIMQVMPGIGPTRSVGAVAVAGTSGTIYQCDVAPFFVCDKSGAGPTDDNCSDGACFGNPVTLASDPAVVSTHFFGLKVGSGDPPATPIATCPSTTPFQTNGCVVIKDQRATDDLATLLVNEADANGFPVVINRATSNDWSFNSGITLNGNFGYLQLLDSNGQNTNSGAPGMKQNVLDSNACIANEVVATQTGNISSLDAAFNALFGEPKPPYSNDPNIGNYADYVGNPLTNPNPPLPRLPPPDNWQPISYNFYSRIYTAKGWTNPNGTNTKFHQRLRNVAVVQCPNPLSGSQSALTVKGHACFFFNRKMYGNSDTGKLQNNEDWVIAEHVDNSLCPPVIGFGRGTPHSILDARVILYQYYNSADS